MDPGRRRELTRYAAPAAFLVAVTIAVLLVKSALDSNSQTTTAALPTTTRATSTAPTTTKIVLTTPTASTSTTSSVPGARYYVIQSGDTLGAVASQYDTTVDELLTLNPGLDPSALQPGQRIRVG